MAGFYHYGKHADAQFHFSLQTTSTILIRWTGLLHQFYRPVNPLRVAIEDPFTFSERLFEVQSFVTRRNPGRMFILTTKAVSIRVYDLKHPTIFPPFEKFLPRQCFLHPLNSYTHAPILIHLPSAGDVTLNFLPPS